MAKIVERAGARIESRTMRVAMLRACLLGFTLSACGGAEFGDGSALDGGATNTSSSVTGVAGSAVTTDAVGSAGASGSGSAGTGGTGSPGGAGGVPVLEGDSSADVADRWVVDSGGVADVTADRPSDSNVRDTSQESGGCQLPSQCPTPASQCQSAVCTTGVCGTRPLPSGPAPKQVTADCRRVDCTTTGLEVTAIDDTDFDDGNECTRDLCAGGMATHTVNLGTRCANGTKFCDPSGACVDCLAPTDCPGVVTECFRKQCIGGHCSTGPRPSGDLCNQLGDQCDGNGNCVDCVNSGGCGECCVCLQNTCVAASFAR
jgi:hypothetical protein